MNRRSARDFRPDLVPGRAASSTFAYLRKVAAVVEWAMAQG